MVIVAILTIAYISFPKKTLDSRRKINNGDRDSNKDESISI